MLDSIDELNKFIIRNVETTKRLKKTVNAMVSQQRSLSQ